MPESIHSHQYTRITSSGDGGNQFQTDFQELKKYSELILAIGSHEHANAEILNVKLNQWSSINNEYGGHHLIFAAPVIWTQGAFYVVGGFKDTRQADLHGI